MLLLAKCTTQHYGYLFIYGKQFSILFLTLEFVDVKTVKKSGIADEGEGEDSSFK